MAKKKAEGGEAPASEEASAAPKISKTDAVKAAIAAGVDKPKEGVAWILEKHGIEVSTGMFSSLKSTSKTKGGSPSKSGKVKVAKDKPAPRGRETHGFAANGKGNPAKLAESVKQLVKDYGASNVSAMVKVFE